jgi:hypothetical protein
LIHDITPWSYYKIKLFKKIVKTSIIIKKKEGYLMAIVKGKLIKDVIKEIKECNKVELPTPKLLEMFDYMEKKKMFVSNYEEKHKKNIGKDIKKLTYRDVKTELTYIYEEDKKYGGIIIKACEEGVLIELLERMYRLQLAMV